MLSEIESEREGKSERMKIKNRETNIRSYSLKVKSLQKVWCLLKQNDVQSIVSGCQRGVIWLVRCSEWFSCCHAIARVF